MDPTDPRATATPTSTPSPVSRAGHTYRFTGHLVGELSARGILSLAEDAGPLEGIQLVM